MSKAVDIIVDQFVSKAVKHGLIMPTRSHPTPDSWKQELQKSFETYSGSQAHKAAQGWYNSLVAAQTKNRYGRQMDLVEKTSPNMIGFFPEYDPNARHSNFAITMFDTETADKNTDIIEAAGFKLIYNKDAKRFERLPNASVSNSQFYGVYNPKDASYVQTEQVHGRNSHMLVSLDGKIPTGWGTEQLNKFLEFSKGTILSGHNIMNADLSWIHGRPTEGFKFIEPTFKQGILDTLHLSAALLGRGKPGEGRNALQKLAQKFNVNAELPGLPAHAGWADTIKNVKVLEHLLAIDHPAAQEFIEAMDVGNRHSHYWENPDPLHNSSYVTHGITQKSSPLGVVGHALNKLKVKAKETILKDIPAALGIEREDYYNGNWDKSSYEEMSMASTDESLKEELSFISQHLGTGSHMTLEMQEAIKDIAANAHWGKAAARSQLLRDIKGLKESEKQYFIRNRGFKSEEAQLLHEAEELELKDIKKHSESEYASLERRAKRFALKARLGGWSSDALNDAISSNSLSEDILATTEFEHQRDLKKAAAWQKQVDAETRRREREATAKQEAQEKFEFNIRKQGWDSQRFWARQDVNQRLEMRDARHQAQKAYQQGYLFHGDIGTLEEKAAIGTKAYREELDKLIDRNQKILNVTKAMAAVPFYNPMTLFNDISNQAHGVRHAAHGILPMWAERPIFRFGDALGNLWGQFRSSFETKYGMASAVAPVAGALGTLGLRLIPGVGPLAAAVGGHALSGGIKLASQALGLGARNEINQYGEGIQHRLNLLGMTTSVLGAFINGLKACVGLFSKLSSLWSYMPSYTMSTLTGVEWSKASGMSIADRMLGFQTGTVSNQYTKLAYQQADLYTSGRYDEKSLVAAARLGIFDLAYAPMGGDVEQQQSDIYDRLYKNIYESGLSKAERQSQLALIKDYSPEMAAMLERGHGMVQAGYKQYRNYKAFQSMFGYNKLGDKENAFVSYTASKWGAAQLSMTQGLSLAGSRAYGVLDELIIKPINQVLWSYARSGKIDWKAIANILNGIIDKLGEIDLKGVHWGKLLALFNPLGDKIKEKLKGIFGPLGQFITELGLTKIEFHKDKLWDFFTGKAELGDVITLVSSKTMGAEKAAEIAQASEKAADIAAQAKAVYGLDPKFQEYLDSRRATPDVDWKKDRASWAVVVDTAAKYADGDTNKLRSITAALARYYEDDTKLITGHGIAAWDAEGMSSLLNREAFAKLKGVLPDELLADLISENLRTEFKAAHHVQDIAELGAETTVTILQEIATLLKNLGITTTTTTPGGDQVKTNVTLAKTGG